MASLLPLLLLLLLLLTSCCRAIIIPDGFTCSAGRYAHFAPRAFDRKLGASCAPCARGQFKQRPSSWGGCSSCPRGRTSDAGSSTCEEVDVARRSIERKAAAVARTAVAARKASKVARSSQHARSSSSSSSHAAVLRGEVRGAVRRVAVPRGWAGCAAGSYETLALEDGSFRPACVLCPEGQFNQLGSSAAVSSSSSSSSSCQHCPPGLWTDAEGSSRCTLRAGAAEQGAPRWSLCPPGTHGRRKQRDHDGSSEPAGCSACPAGRYGLGGSLTHGCSGSCRAGFYGGGGSTTRECDGECEEGAVCGAGSTSARGERACPAGMYNAPFDGLEGCSLAAPAAFRPPGGYASPFSEYGACALGFASRLLEVMVAVRACPGFRAGAGGHHPTNTGTRGAGGASSGFAQACDTAVPAALSGELLRCCDGAEHIGGPRAAARCRRVLRPALAILNGSDGADDGGAAATLAGLAHMERQQQRRRSGGPRMADRAEALLLPLFRSCVSAANALYALGGRSAADLTYVSKSLLAVCRRPYSTSTKTKTKTKKKKKQKKKKKSNRCAHLASIVRYTDALDCALVDCDALLLRAFFYRRSGQNGSDRPLRQLARGGGGGGGRRRSGSLGAGCSFDAVRLAADCGQCEISLGLGGCFGLFRRVARDRRRSGGGGGAAAMRDTYELETPARADLACGPLPPRNAGALPRALRAQPQPRIVLRFDAAGPGPGRWVLGGAQVDVGPFMLSARGDDAVTPDLVPELRWRRHADVMNLDAQVEPLPVIGECVFVPRAP